MAQMVLGVGTSHSPQLSSPTEIWPQYAVRDRANRQLLGRDGAFHDYEELERLWAPVAPEELGDGAWQEKHARVNRALDALAESLAAASLDAVVIVGDDQDELFRDDGIPTFAVLWADEVVNIPPSPQDRARIPPDVQAGLWSYHGDVSETYAVESNLARHLVESLVGDEFDVTQVQRQPEGRTLGHAFTFVQRRLMAGLGTPIVPVAVNAYYPPNQPTARRCLEFGRALGRAIESWDLDARIAVVASGGLSHFVVDEELDHRVLDAIANRSLDELTTIPQAVLRSGTSEIRNWIVAAGALEALDLEVVAYVPAFRTSAGTGVGMACAKWTPRVTIDTAIQ